MKKFLLLITFLISFVGYSQFNEIKKQKIEADWDQGIPYLNEDPHIKSLTDKLTFDSLLINNKHKNKESVKLCREIGIAFYNRGMYEAADWYLSRVKDYVEVVDLEPEKVFEIPQEIPEEKISENLAASLAADKQFLNNLPKSYDNLSPNDMKKIAKEIEGKIQKLIKVKQLLIENGENQTVIDEKVGTIKSLKKEK